MRFLLLLFFAGNAAARNRCNQRLLLGVENLPVQDLVARLLKACPEPPNYLTEWLQRKAEPLKPVGATHQLSSDALGAELELLDARDAYVHGNYDAAVRMTKVMLCAAPEIEEWLIAGGLPSGRAHKLAITIDPRSPDRRLNLERTLRTLREIRTQPNGLPSVQREYDPVDAWHGYEDLVFRSDVLPDLSPCKRPDGSVVELTVNFVNGRVASFHCDDSTFQQCIAPILKRVDWPLTAVELDYRLTFNGGPLRAVTRQPAH
jgi:hypothetical protein